MHGRRHRQAVRQCFVCRIGRQIGVQIDAAGQAKAQRAFARNTCACRATSRCWGICVLARCALPSENLCAGKLACKICNSQIRLLPHHGISGSRLGLALASSFLWAICSVPSFGISKFARTFGLQYQQSGRLQWAFACIFKRVATIVPRNPESNQRPNLLLLCMFFSWWPWSVSNRAGLKWGVALASHASRFLREAAFAVERDAPDAIRTCDLCFRKAELGSGDCLKQQFEMVACPGFEPAR